MSDLIVGIDLGTTNSEIAALAGGTVQVLGPGETRMLPSCVGFSPSGELLVGEAARHQQVLYPERTVRSIKRRMGTSETVSLGDKPFTPQEISALILRELVEWAARSLGARPEKAVITVPAYFSDAQRTATREAGALAGLDVVRILNEPTAASLSYGYSEGARHTVLVYDLGGGTFDVSVVTIEGEVTEVLASHGNNHLGGDDFDDLLVDHLAKRFLDQHGVDPRQASAAARARLWWAGEEAKKKLSAEPYVKVREEALVSENGTPLHLDVEVSREDYEALIRPLLDSTLDSVSQALQDAGRRGADLDAILLVGGSTRTPLVTQLLVDRTGIEPRQEVHPDLCVALGAGVLASRLGGHAIERVLVDVSPYSFGVSYLGERGGVPYPHCYHPIVRRNTPLPITRTDSYVTASPYQTKVQLQVYQGDDEDALRNILVGDFMIEGLARVADPNEVLCRMRLDLDGILEVTAVEKETGKSKHITIANALRARTPEEIAAGRERIRELYESRGSVSADFEDEGADEISEADADERSGDLSDGVSGDRAGDLSGDDAGEPSGAHLEEFSGEPEAHPAAPAKRPPAEISALMERSRRLLDRMHDEDREEAIELHERIEAALESADPPALLSASQALKELLFFVEGQA